MFDPITMRLHVDPLIQSALEEDINSEDVSTNCVAFFVGLKFSSVCLPFSIQP